MTSNIFLKIRCLNKNLESASKFRMFSRTQTYQFFSRSITQQKKADESSTVNEYHANKFTSEVKEWWEPNGPLKALHAMNLIRVPFIRDGLLRTPASERTDLPLRNKKILDVGCGGGILSESLAKIGAEVTGIDANNHLIELAKCHAESNNKLQIKPTYSHSIIEDHSAKFPNHYDGVVASEVIEHVNNKELFVKSCVAALKPGGKIFFTTPNRTRFTQVFGIWVAEYVLNLLPRGTHEYNMMITPSELTFLLERNNCQVEITVGMMYNFINNTFNFVSSQHLLFALQAVKLS
ncbi:ubiquinone biosynthesis O-methyltransferase-like isoform X2 [Plodia interpunctella]|uniref:ubiquinone biosynthesis O-methyltransferase-like isoform X2 n=1 Tax=Plodia interpunctella TaxID=58824 RepID=UPI002368E327|nr:ubiquinone biosynthesis O-methyltransferase-like isoform X2 [Plodia interpunctella]